MTRDEAREYIIKNSAAYLKPDRSGKGFICPICNSGSGAHGTGITTKDGVHFTCWAGCFTNSDVIDVIGIEKGLTDYSSKLKAAAAEFNITIDGWGGGSGFNSTPSNKQPAKKENAPKGRVEPKNVDKEKDYSDFFLEANKHIEETDYHRGLTLDTLNRFKVGFIRNWKHPKAPDYVAPTPRLIIPTSAETYLARDTRADIPANQKQYAKSKVAGVHIFNTAALYAADKPIFVVEGEIDALSIIDVGGEAVGLGSIQMVGTLLRTLKERKPTQPLIIAFDNDKDSATIKRVEKQKNKLIEGLQSLNIPFYAYNPAGNYKDANEALNADRERFKKAVNAIDSTPIKEKIEAAIEAAERAAAERLEAADEEQRELEKKIQRESLLFHFAEFEKAIAESKEAPLYPTGFKELDNFLDGGLHTGLYVVGAITSLGKTTFCLQIADQIAKAGNDVLIFSLEMARIELWAKSISRLTFMNDIQTGKPNAKTTRGILTGKLYDKYNQEEKELIEYAKIEYSKNYMQRIWIEEGIGNIGINEIKAKIEEHIRGRNGRKPVVIIDYLQIIAPIDMRATDKQNTDRAVLELKRTSRDLDIPIVGISSFNRDNYNAPVNVASFKESGAIEYSSDVLIGLQREGMDYIDGEKEPDRLKRISRERHAADEAARMGRAQNIQVKILKNRNGAKGVVDMEFYPKFNYFKERTKKMNAVKL